MARTVMNNFSHHGNNSRRDQDGTKTNNNAQPSQKQQQLPFTAAAAAIVGNRENAANTTTTSSSGNPRIILVDKSLPTPPTSTTTSTADIILNAGQTTTTTKMTMMMNHRSNNNNNKRVFGDFTEFTTSTTTTTPSFSSFRTLAAAAAATTTAATTSFTSRSATKTTSSFSSMTMLSSSAASVGLGVSTTPTTTPTTTTNVPQSSIVICERRIGAPSVPLLFGVKKEEEDEVEEEGGMTVSASTQLAIPSPNIKIENLSATSTTTTTVTSTATTRGVAATTTTSSAEDSIMSSSLSSSSDQAIMPQKKRKMIMVRSSSTTIDESSSNSNYDNSTDEEVHNFASTLLDDDDDDDDDGGGGNNSTTDNDARVVSSTQLSIESINNDDDDDDNNNNNNNNSNDDDDDDDDDDEDSVDTILRDDYYLPDGKLAFCCQNCSCWETRGDNYLKYIQVRNNCGNSSGDGGVGNIHLYHRGCCHGHTAFSEDYLSPMQEAIDKGFSDGKKCKKSSKHSLYTKNQIKKMYDSAMKEEARFENDETNEDATCSIHGNSTFNEYAILFQERRNHLRRKPLKVLDLFSGIGSGTAALKRLELPIELIVHVEHDPVAVEVCKFNHKNDNIDHQYLRTFEEIYGMDDEVDHQLLTTFVKKYGPIDLVLSAAPCQNYSGLNARCDRSAENAQYLLKVGRLIHKLDYIQMKSMGVKENVLFLSENVVFKDTFDIDKSYASGEGALPPICIDALDFSPCKRKRFYWMNFPVNNTAPIKEVASFESVDKVLDDGYTSIARLFMDGDVNATTVKANTFLASTSRIDDDRMLKCKVDASVGSLRYTCETYSVREREKMMGLPVGYVAKPLQSLFGQLTTNAFLKPETSMKGETYRDFLRRDLWHFRRQCHYKFLPVAEHPFFQLAISSPLEGKKQFAFFTEDSYCKRLIGNGWSIPVVEHLLEKLKDIFDEDALVSYRGYSYAYPWEPYMSIKRQSRSL